MKQLLFELLGCILALVFCYGIAVFITAEPDIRQWNENGRIAFFGVSVIIGTYGCYFSGITK